jgi:hypothetical protein
MRPNNPRVLTVVRIKELFFAEASRRARASRRFGTKRAFAGQMLFARLLACSADILRREAVARVNGFDPDIRLMENADRVMRTCGAEISDEVVLYYTVCFPSLMHAPDSAPERLQEQRAGRRRMQAKAAFTRFRTAPLKRRALMSRTFEEAKYPSVDRRGMRLRGPMGRPGYDVFLRSGNGGCQRIGVGASDHVEFSGHYQRRAADRAEFLQRIVGLGPPHIGNLAIELGPVRRVRGGPAIEMRRRRNGRIGRWQADKTGRVEIRPNHHQSSDPRRIP